MTGSWTDDWGAVCSGPEGVPSDFRTLGWDVISWVVKWLVQPDGPGAGGRFVPTADQVRFICQLYEIDENGRFTYRRAVLRRMKGAGKDPLAAVLALAELCGPCRFSRFDDEGFPVAARASAPWVQVAAVSREQTRTTMTLFPAVLPKRTIERFGLSVGKEVIHAEGGGRIEAITSSPRAMEGARPTMTIANETQHWITSNGGHQMMTAIRRNIAKNRDGSARVVELCNAHMPGEDSIAEQSCETYQAMQAGTTRGGGLLYSSREAPADVVLSDPESLRQGLVAARGDAEWIDVDRLMDEVYDPSTPAEVSRRYYLNQVVAAEDAWVSPVEWDRCESGETLERGDRIALGFDGSSGQDATALVACRIEDGLLTPLGVWEPPENFEAMRLWNVPRGEVVEAVSNAFNTYDIVGFFADVAHWESYIEQWDVELGPLLRVKASSKSMIAWDMRSRGQLLTRAVESLRQAIEAGVARHDGDRVLRKHVVNARKRPNRWGVSFGKESRSSRRKVDGLAASVLARMCRQDFLTNGKPEYERGVVVL